MSEGMIIRRGGGNNLSNKNAMLRVICSNAHTGVTVTGTGYSRTIPKEDSFIAGYVSSRVYYFPIPASAFGSLTVQDIGGTARTTSISSAGREETVNFTVN